jgi:hypothetical protein
MTYQVCEHKESARIALLSDADERKDWIENGQEIEANSWLEAREKVDMSNIWESPYGEYYYVK